MRSWHAVVDCRDTPGTAPGPCPGSPSSCRVVEMAAGAERHCRRHRAAVGRPPCWSPGRRLVPFLGMPSTFPVLRSLGDLPAEMPADVLERPDLPLQDGATASPDAVGAVPARWLGRLWRMAFAFLVAASGVSHLTDGETAAREFCNSAGALASELRGSRTGASGHCAWGGGVEADTPTAPCPPPAGARSAPGADPAPGQHVTWAGVPGWHPSATAGRGNSGGQEMQRWATRAAWSALNPVPLFSRTNTTMLLTKSSRPSGECGVAGGPGPGRLRPGAPRQHLGKRRRSGCGSSARGVQAAVRLAGAP